MPGSSARQRQHVRRRALPISGDGQAGQDGGLSAVAGSRHSRGEGVLPKGFRDKSDAAAAQGDPGRSCAEPLRAKALAAGEPEVGIRRNA